MVPNCAKKSWCTAMFRICSARPMSSSTLFSDSGTSDATRKYANKANVNPVPYISYNQPKLYECTTFHSSGSISAKGTRVSNLVSA